MWEYPFAVAGVNITYMLIQMLDLEAGLLLLLVLTLFAAITYLFRGFTSKMKKYVMYGQFH